MDIMPEFNYESAREISNAVSGKTIESVEVRDEHADDFLIFKFKDGSELEFRYDWIYDWEISTKTTGDLNHGKK